MGPLQLVYYKPFEVSTKGFFYMRIGEDSVGGIWPVPRRPLHIPGVDPPACKVIITTMQPYHDDWETFSSGDHWDKPNEMTDVHGDTVRQRFLKI